MVTSIYNDNEDGALQVTRHLLATGCRCIGLIHGTRGHYFTESIIKGYTRALGDAGSVLDPMLLTEGDFHLQGGYHAMVSLLDRKPDIDAVFTNDEMAVGALRAIKERGRKVPEDIAIFGFDNLRISQQTEPRLSTVSVNYEQMAKMAVRRIIDSGADESITPVRIIVPVQLIVRESTRPVRGPG